MNTIKWHVKALRQLRKLDRQASATVRAAVDGLAAMPACPGVKALTNHKCGYRLRVGAFRVLFDFDGEIRVVDIQEIKKRNERTD